MFHGETVFVVSPAEPHVAIRMGRDTQALEVSHLNAIGLFFCRVFHNRE